MCAQGWAEMEVCLCENIRQPTLAYIPAKIKFCPNQFMAIKSQYFGISPFRAVLASGFESDDNFNTSFYQPHNHKLLPPPPSAASS